MSDPGKSRPRSEKEIFFDALEKHNPQERAAFLDGACGTNPVQRAKVEALLANHFQSDAFMKEPAQQGDRPTLKLDLAPEAAPAQMLGRYKLLEKIGEGGFGEVWMAEQREPVKRRVALKIIKLGMDSLQIVARFEAERQALAMMDHPNIAKIFDAGTIESDEPRGSGRESAPSFPSESQSRLTSAAMIGRGRPYFVMELVRGIKITEYCDQNQLPTQERLRLFILVCQAIQHAHQKGIIHRDIKPSNILVTLHDGVPVPKVIDFGIAKATQGELTDKTVFTQFQQFIGTPAYISPEQAEMSGLDIDTRADIYSLGVLLYELLVGQTPFDAREMLQGGLDALRQMIREKEPLRPSTKLNTLQGDARTTAGKRRQTDTGKLVHQLQGDLDWIVMKCLEKDRTRRYETANGLASDIQRHLNNEAVLARPPSAAYRFQKLVRRNKLAFTAVAAVICILVLGATISTWQAVRATVSRREAVVAQQNEAIQRHAAEEQRQRAETERERAVQNEQAVRESLYAAQMSQALDAWFEGDILRARDLLDRQRPLSAQKDLRGLEWRLLWQKCQPSGERSIVGLADSWVVATTLTPDGNTLLVHEASGARLYDFASRREVARIEGVWAQASRNSGFVAVATTNNSVVLWNVSERREIASCPKREDWAEPFFLSQSGEKLAFLTANGIVKIWNLSSDTLSAELHLDSDRANGLTVSPDEKMLAFNTPEQIQVREVGGKGPLMSVALAQGELEMQLARCLDQNLRFCAYALRDNTIGIWEVMTGRRVASLRGHSGRIQEIQFSPDGNRLVSISSDATAKLWDCADWAEVTTFKGHFSSIYSLAFSPDGRFLATGGNDQAIKLWNLNDRTEVATFRGHTADVLSLAFSPDGQTLISRAHDGSIRFWDVSDPKDDSWLGKHGAWIRSVAISSTGLLASGSMDGSIKLWDMTSRREIATIREGHGAMVCNLAFSPDGQTLVSTHGDRRVRLWSVAARKQIEALPIRGHGEWISKVSFSPDGQTIAFGDSGNNLVLWHLATHRVTATIRGFNEPVRATAISPDGKIIAAAGMDGTLTFWDLATTDLLSRHKAHTGQYGVMDLNFSPDGKRLATAGWDRLVKLWDVSKNAEKSTFKGHRGVVDTAIFSPDGKTLVTASADSTIKLWRVDMQLEVGTLRGHTSPATTVAFSPDGTLLATAGGDTTIRLWRAPSWAEIEEAEARENTEIKQP